MDLTIYPNLPYIFFLQHLKFELNVATWEASLKKMNVFGKSQGWGISKIRSLVGRGNSLVSSHAFWEVTPSMALSIVMHEGKIIMNLEFLVGFSHLL